MYNQIKNKLLLSALIAPAYAQLNLAPKGEDFTPLTKVTGPSIISGAIDLAIIITVVVFFFILLLGGIKWTTASGDDKKLASARSQITNGLTGLVIVFCAWAVMGLISRLFNINITNLSIPSFTSK